MDCVLACEPQGHWFDSQSGHVPGFLSGQVPGEGARERHPHIDVSLPLSFPSPSLKNKIFFFLKKETFYKKLHNKYWLSSNFSKGMGKIPWESGPFNRLCGRLSRALQKSNFGPYRTGAEVNSAQTGAKRRLLDYQTWKNEQTAQ